MKWYRKAADKNYPYAEVHIGQMYATGDGVTKNEVEAVKWYRRSADHGDATAQRFLGNRYISGKGVPKDEVEAVKWWRKAAEQGESEAQHNIGVTYTEGLGGFPKDPTEAVKWYCKAADQGYVTSAAKLGEIYDKGIGVPKDDLKSINWYKKAAEKGDLISQFNLGQIYRNGRQGIQNDAEASKWNRKAIEQIDPESPGMCESASWNYLIGLEGGANLEVSYYNKESVRKTENGFMLWVAKTNKPARMMPSPNGEVKVRMFREKVEYSKDFKFKRTLECQMFGERGEMVAEFTNTQNVRGIEMAPGTIEREVAIQISKKINKNGIAVKRKN